MAIRIVVCIDVDHDTLEDAYREVYEAMTATGLAWESSDEWFDVDGQQVIEEACQAARMKVFAALTDRPDLSFET